MNYNHLAKTVVYRGRAHAEANDSLITWVHRVRGGILSQWGTTKVMVSKIQPVIF